MHIPPSPANKSTAGILWLLLLLWLLSWAAVVDRITRTFGEATRRMADVSVDARDRTATRCKSLYQINELIKIRLAITVLTISALAPTVSLSLSLSSSLFQASTLFGHCRSEPRASTENVLSQVESHRWRCGWNFTYSCCECCGKLRVASGKWHVATATDSIWISFSVAPVTRAYIIFIKIILSSA